MSYLVRTQPTAFGKDREWTRPEIEKVVTDLLVENLQLRERPSLDKPISDLLP